MDLNPLLVKTDSGENPRFCLKKGINPVPDTLDEKIWNDIKEIVDKNKTECEFDVENNYRAVGTRLSHHIYEKFGKDTLKEDNIIIKLNGSAGQSLGAFLAKGIKIIVNGDSNDYVGKGLSGGSIIVKPAKNSNLVSNENAIITTLFYMEQLVKTFASGSCWRDLQSEIQEVFHS